MCRRSASSKVDNAGDPRVEQAPNTYEMSSDEISQSTYSIIGKAANFSQPKKVKK